MSTPPEALCRLAWPLIPSDEQWRLLTDVYVPPPMRISASPKANQQTFFHGINESANNILRQLGEHHFTDEAARAYRLRSALFQCALDALRHDVYDLTAASTTGGSGPVRALPPDGADGARRPGARHTAKTDRGGRPNAHGSSSSSCGAGAVRGDKIESTCNTSSASAAADPASPASRSAGQSHATTTTTNPLVEGSSAFYEVLKPHALIAHVLDGDAGWAVIEHDVAQLITCAVSPLVPRVGAEETPTGTAAPTASQSLLVHTAAQLCLRAGFVPRAGRAFVTLLTALLSREKDLAAGALATAAKPARVDAPAETPPSPQRRHAAAATVAADNGLAAADIHRAFVWFCLVPVLHFIPLTDWSSRDQRAIGHALVGAHAPRVRVSSLDGNCCTVTTTFSTKTLVSVHEVGESRKPPREPTVPAAAHHPGGTNGNTIAVNAEEGPSSSFATGGDAAATAPTEPHLGGENGDEWVWGHELPIPAAASGQQRRGQGEPAAHHPSATTASDDNSDTDGDTSASLEEEEDAAAAAAAAALAHTGHESSDGDWESVPHDEEEEEEEEEGEAEGEDDGNDDAQSTSSALHAELVAAQDLTQDRISLLCAPHASRVTIKVHAAIRCGSVRFVLLPMHPSQEEGDVLPVCKQPSAGDTYIWDGPCEVRVVCMNKAFPTTNPGGVAEGRSHVEPALDAEITTELSVDLDTRWELEWSLSLLHAQRHLASELLADLYDTTTTTVTAQTSTRAASSPTANQASGSPVSFFSPKTFAGAGAINGPATQELPPALFGRGLRCTTPSSAPPPSPPHPFVDAVRTLPDTELRLRTRCRASDLPGVRAVLTVIAHFFTSTRPRLDWSWRTPDWLDAVRRVSLSSASLDKRSNAGELASFLVEAVEGNCSPRAGCPPASPSALSSSLSASPTAAQVVDAAISFFSRGDYDMTAAELEDELVSRTEAAQTAVVMLQLLEDACGHSPSPKNLTLVAKALKSFLMLKDGGHYLSNFTGCGLSLEATVRQHVHGVMTKLYTLLRGVVARAGKVQSSPQRFLFESWEYGAFAILAVSLLVSQLDTEDMAFVTRGIASQVTTMLPDFTNLARTESFLVDEGEEVNFIKVFAEYFCEVGLDGAEGAGGATVAAAAAALSPATAGTPAPLLGHGGRRNTVAEWGSGELSMSGAHQDSPHSFSSLGKSALTHSKEPVFSHERTFTGGPKTFNVHLLNDRLTSFYIGLATPSLGFTRPDHTRDSDGMYYLSEGRMCHKGDSTTVLPLRSGDVVSLVFSFETTRWRVGFVLNGFLLASFVVPTQPLYLVLGYTDKGDYGAKYRGTCGRPLYMPQQPEERGQALPLADRHDAQRERGRQRLRQRQRLRSSSAESPERMPAATRATLPRDRSRSLGSSASPRDTGGESRGRSFTSPTANHPTAGLHPSHHSAPRGGPVYFSSAPTDVRRLRLLCRGPHMKPTFYNTSLFTALVFHYLIVTCTRKQQQQQQQQQRGAAGGLPGALPVPSSSSSTAAIMSSSSLGWITPLTHHREDTLRKFVDCCGAPLRRNVQLLVRSLATLPPPPAATGTVATVSPSGSLSSFGNAAAAAVAVAVAGGGSSTTSNPASGDRGRRPDPSNRSASSSSFASPTTGGDRDGGGDSTERVKRRTAALVYNNLLLDYTISLAVALRVTSSPVDVMNALTDVVCCGQAATKTRSVALSAVYNAIMTQSPAAGEEGGPSGSTGDGDDGCGGFGLFAFNPERLWNCCKELAADSAAGAAAWRPTFTSETVPNEIVVKSGGRSIVYKPGGPQRSGQRTVSYATEGIPLDGSRGETISFSARIQRGFQTDSLGRFYHVGVACRTSGDAVTRTLTTYPGERQRQHVCYSVTDHFQDVIEPKADMRNDASETRAELKRHEANWLSADESIVFGSGDVITVTVHCKTRCISFERNGKPLGTLYRKLPRSVKVLFPFIELYNRDSMAKWMYSPNELLVHARYTMRAMLRYWTPELAPKLHGMIEASQTSGDCTPMQVLGADGDELSQVYRAPPRSEVQTSVQNVRLVRTEGRFAVIEDESGAAHRVVAAALEPNHGSVMAMGDALSSLFVADMLKAVLAETEIEEEVDAGHLLSYVRVRHPAVLVRLLRLLSEGDGGTGSEEDGAMGGGSVNLTASGQGASLEACKDAALSNARRAVPAEEDAELRTLRAATVGRLLELLKVRTLDLPGDVLLREAWNEICWTPDGAATQPLRLSLDESCSPLPPPPTSPGAASTSSVKSCISVSSLVSLYAEEDGTYVLLCPTCGRQWNECVDHHEAPANTCVLGHLILRRFGQPSPYTGWYTTWRTIAPGATPAAAATPSPTAPARQGGQAATAAAGVAAGAEATPQAAVPTLTTTLDEDEMLEATSSGSAYSVMEAILNVGATREEEAAATGPVDAQEEEEEADHGSSGDGEDDYGTDYEQGEGEPGAVGGEEEDDDGDDDDDDTDMEEGEQEEQGSDVPAEASLTLPPATAMTAAAAREAFHAVTITFEAVESSASCEGGAGHVRGSGETKNGVFTFVGQLTSATTMQGRIMFQQGTAEDEKGDGDGDGEGGAEWSCAACTFHNEPGANRCAICATPRPGAMWACAVCSYAYNPNSANMCATCGQLRGGAGGALRNLLGLRGADRVCYCETCHAKREYRYFKNLSLYQNCDRCGGETRWLPKDPFSGMMEARIVGDGDRLEFTWHVDGATESAYALTTAAYSASQLTRLVRESVPDGANQLSRYVPPLTQHSALEETALQRKEPDGIQTCLPSAVVYYASRLVLLWGPAMSPDIFTDAEVLMRLLVFDESWLEPLRSVSLAAATSILHTCLAMLLAGVESPHVIETISSAARVLMKANPSLNSQRHYLLYALSVTANRYCARRTREVCYSCMAKLFEDYPHDFVNAQCLSSVLRRQPVVAGQRRVIVHAVLRHVSVGEASTASTKAASCLARTITCMEAEEAVPRLLDTDMSHAFPYVVALAETRINEGGQLQVGQIRGSVGYAPTKGGRYYYEIVLPANFADSSNTIVMGWGTLQHEHLSSSQHVGSDLHSWGFNCRDRLRLMMGEQLMAVPQRPAPGDIIGSMMDLETMMVSWSVNGESLMWVSVPAQGESEEIYPFVSAAVEPCGVEVRLGNTQFRPDDYADYSPPSDAQMWSVTSNTAAPQTYAFYHELCTLLDEVSATDLTVKSSVVESLASPPAQRALTRYPAVLAAVLASNNENSSPRTKTTAATRAASTSAGADVDMSRLIPYLQHLSAISDLTVMVARNYPMIDGSPFLTECYRKARGLLFGTARWVIFETQIGGRPTFNASHSRTVRIDLQKAQNAIEDVHAASASASGGSSGHAATGGGAVATTTTIAARGGGIKTEQLALTQSVTGQLFRQTETAPIYKNATMFTVQLAGDVTNDAGGVTRSILSMIADELNFQTSNGVRLDPAVPLFKLCGHSSMFTVVPNMERLLFEDDAEVEGDDDGDQRLCHRMLTWLGMLMGNITLCGTMKLTLNFPRIAWKFFTFTTPTIADYYHDVDDTVRGSLADDNFLLNDEYYYSIPGILLHRQQQQLQAQAQGSAGVGLADSHLPTRMPRSASTAATSPANAGRSSSNSGSGAAGGPGAGQGNQHNRFATSSSAAVGGAAAGGTSSLHTGTLGRGLSRPLRPYSCMTPAISAMDLGSRAMSRASSRVNLSTALADMDEDDEDAVAAATEAVAAANREREARRRRQDAEQALLHQYDAAFQCMRNGLASVLSHAALRAIRWDDLQTRICGAPNVSAQHVAASLDWAAVSDTLKDMLMQVLTEMTEKERGLFLLFCSGQSRLPLPEKISVTCGDDPALIPTAHTCSPISLRLQPYRTAEEMRQKLDMCLSNAKQFGFV